MNVRLPYRLLIPIACLLLPACQQKMAVQPSARPDEASTFFADGRVDRPLVPNTVARGHLRTDLHLFAGKKSRGNQRDQLSGAVAMLGALANPWNLAALEHTELSPQIRYANDVDTFPFPITAEVLEHGHNRFLIYCVVCHDALGTGHGKIVERGYTQPPSYHIDRLRNAPVGHFFDVITNGYGSMPEYRQQVPPRDRWAIAAYIRALQLSQHFPANELPANLRAEMKEQGAAP